MTGTLSNLFGNLPRRSEAEQFTTLLETGLFKLVRIVSTGQAMPEGEWYDQEETEWVVLLRGRAGLAFEGEAAECVLEPGDFVEIAPHRRHRVTWTDTEGPTVWLALHFADDDAEREP